MKSSPARLVGLALFLALVRPPARATDPPWLYGIHWYGDPAGSLVETMTGGKPIWSLETVLTNSDVWWGAQWQLDNRFNAMAARGHTIIARLDRNWGETVPFPQNLAQYLVDLQGVAQTLSGVCHIWQVGNEMNLYGEWGGQQLTPAVYVDELRQIRAALKSVTSPLGEQIVLLGPVSPGGIVPGIRHTDGNEYLAQMCALLAPTDLDGFAIHAYAAPWNDAPTCRRELQAGYQTQLAVIRTLGLGDKPVYLTEWNRRVEPIDDGHEAQSAQFLHGALADLSAWNGLAGGYPIRCACWFIYAYDSGVWANYSIEYLHGIGPPGPENDLWDALQYACTLDLLGGTPASVAARMYHAVPPGVNVALNSVAVSTDSGDGALAIDGVISAGSKWTSAGTVPPHWLQLDLGRLCQLSGFVVRHAGAGGEAGYFNTTALSLQVAAEASGPWEIEDLVYNATAADSTARTYFEPRLARHVRLYVTDAGIDDYARIPEFEVYALPLVGDYNGDGDVDFGDFGALLFCLHGPNRPYVEGHYCRAGDCDGDADIDVADVAGFQVSFTGEL